MHIVFLRFKVEISNGATPVNEISSWQTNVASINSFFTHMCVYVCIYRSRLQSRHDGEITGDAGKGNTSGFEIWQTHVCCPWVNFVYTPSVVRVLLASCLHNALLWWGETSRARVVSLARRREIRCKTAENFLKNRIRNYIRIVECINTKSFIDLFFYIRRYNPFFSIFTTFSIVYFTTSNHL